MKKRKNIFDELEDILKSNKGLKNGDFDIKLDLRPITTTDNVIGELTELEVALFAYREQLMQMEFELMEVGKNKSSSNNELANCQEARLCEVLKVRGYIVHSLLWDCILSRFPDEDETSLEICAGFQIVKIGDQIVLYLSEAQNPNPGTLH